MSADDHAAAWDMHSHLVPGVDDGARTVEDTLESVERMTRAGVRRIITTPHLNASLTHDRGALAARLEEVDIAFAGAAAAVREQFPEVQFLRGHEVMLDVPDGKLTDERLRLAGTAFVLVEWPRLQVPPGTIQALARLRGDGLRPVIAHPERYVGVEREIELVGEWKRSGAFLQVNYGSFVGRYGAEAKKNAFRLLRRGWIDYLSTDFHGRPHLSLYKAEAFEKLEELGAQEQLYLLTVSNPGRLLRGENPIPAPPLLAPSGLWNRLKEIFTGSDA